jgi:TldD protein
MVSNKLRENIVKTSVWLWILGILILGSVLMGAERDVRKDSYGDPIFRAMNDELQRSMDRLVIEGMPAPYFLSYRIRDYQTETVNARYNALVESDQSRNRYLYIDLRVGSPQLDNSNFYSGWEDIWKSRENVVEEDSYQALRHQLWYHTDQAYKDALEQLARKKAYQQTHPEKEEIPDFSTEKPFVYSGTPVQVAPNRQQWEEKVRNAGAVFDNYPGLQDWKVEYSAQTVNQWYVNSEGSQHLKGELYQFLEVSASMQAEDGQRLTSFLQYVSRDGDEPVSGAVLETDIKRMAGELEAVAKAPTLDEYVGPVLFTDWASEQFFSQLFANQLSLPRKPLTAADWMSDNLPVGKLAGKVKRHILPEFVTITDEPQRENWEGKPLAGFQMVDDEGVASENITLVEKGRLETLPKGRQPTKKIPQSNGHSHSLPFQMTVPGISNLIVTSSKPFSSEKMVQELRRLCREQDMEYGLLIKRLDEPRFDEPYRWIQTEERSKPLLRSPLIAYKVYAKDGRMEPVRGLEFDEVAIRTLRDIVALGKDAQAYNITQTTVFSDGYYPAAIVCPSILVEEMELKAAGVQEPLPVAENPIFTK